MVVCIAKALRDSICWIFYMCQHGIILAPEPYKLRKWLYLCPGWWLGSHTELRLAQNSLLWICSRVSPWTLCCMFPSPSPAAIPLLESCTISRAKVGLANLPSSNPTLVITFFLANQNRRICYLLTPFLSCSHSHFNDVFSSERATIVQFWKSEALWFSHYKAQQKNKTGAKDFTFFIFPLLCSYPNDPKIGTFLWFSQQFSLTYTQGEMLLLPVPAVPLNMS